MRVYTTNYYRYWRNKKYSGSSHPAAGYPKSPRNYANSSHLGYYRPTKERRWRSKSATRMLPIAQRSSISPPITYTEKIRNPRMAMMLRARQMNRTDTPWAIRRGSSDRPSTRHTTPARLERTPTRTQATQPSTYINTRPKNYGSSRLALSAQPQAASQASLRTLRYDRPSAHDNYKFSSLGSNPSRRTETRLPPSRMDPTADMRSSLCQSLEQISIGSQAPTRGYPIRSPLSGPQMSGLSEPMSCAGSNRPDQNMFRHDHQQYSTFQARAQTIETAVQAAALPALSSMNKTDARSVRHMRLDQILRVDAVYCSPQTRQPGRDVLPSSSTLNPYGASILTALPPESHFRDIAPVQLKELPASLTSQSQHNDLSARMSQPSTRIYVAPPLPSVDASFQALSLPSPTAKSSALSIPGMILGHRDLELPPILSISSGDARGEPALSTSSDSSL